MEMSTIGMRSEVAIRVAARDGVSYLVSSYFTPPFKVANITEDKRGPFLHLMLMCSSPGILDGDEQTIRVRIAAKGRLQLHTQSYQRLFQMKSGAVQRMEVQLEKDAFFCWLPHPCVPHANSIFTGRNRIILAEGCQLLWGEVLTCGRKLNGEVFALSSYHVRTEIFAGDELILLENMYLRPGVLPVEAMGQMEGFTHQASLLWVGGCIGEKSAQIESCLSGREGVIGGVSAGPKDSLVIRLLGNGAEILYDILKAIAEICKQN
jgi:urease accessory protein